MNTFDNSFDKSLFDKSLFLKDSVQCMKLLLQLLVCIISFQVTNITCLITCVINWILLWELKPGHCSDKLCTYVIVCLNFDLILEVSNKEVIAFHR